MDTILSLGIIQSLLLAIVIWRKKGIDTKLKANLGGLLILSACVLFGKLTYEPGAYVKYGAFFALTDVLLFMFGPLSYFLTRVILKAGKLTSKQIFVHYIPALIHVLILNTIIGLIFTKGIFGWRQNEVLFLYKVIELSGIISCSFYVIKSHLIFQKSKEYFYENYASPRFPEFLRYFILTTGILTILWFAGYINFLFKIVKVENAWMVYSVFWHTITIALYVLSYFLLAFPDLLKMPVLKQEKKTIKEEKELFDKKLLDEQKEIIQDFMQKQKPYLNSNITLEGLAELTKIKRHDLSYIINNAFCMNFFDFINHFRIIEFIRLFNERKGADINLTFIEIAFETGFNSKSAFYRAFKKEKKNTPSQYFDNQNTAA